MRPVRGFYHNRKFNIKNGKPHIKTIKFSLTGFPFKVLFVQFVCTAESDIFSWTRTLFRSRNDSFSTRKTVRVFIKENMTIAQYVKLIRQSERLLPFSFTLNVVHFEIRC